MSNIQVTHDISLNNARSESSLVINPHNPLQVVSASKKFNNIQTYDFTLATEYSTDGGLSWTDSAALAMPGFTVMTDPTMAWDDVGNVFLVGLAGKNPPTWDTIGIVIYKSTDGGKTWSPPKMIHQSTGDDKQWASGDSNPASPHHGNVYAVWDDTNSGTILFARTKDNGATWIGPGAAASPSGGAIANGSMYPEIDVAEDGTIFVASISGDEIRLAVSRDGGDTFQPTPSPATGITTLSDALPAPGGFPIFPGGNFRVLTDPTACAFGSTVMVAWADYREGVSRIYYAQSNDRGASWVTGSSGRPLLTGPLSSTLHHFHPQIIDNPDGVIGCSFYEFGPKPTTPLIDVIMAQSFDGGNSFVHYPVTDQPWNPTVDAPWSHGNSSVTFIGDYMGLDANSNGFYPLWTDTRTGIQELFTAIVPQRRCEIIVNRSTLGQDEVDARRKLAGGANAVIPDAFRVVVDGYSAAQINVTGTGSTINVAAPGPGMTVSCTGNFSGNGDYGPEVQRFTFIFDIDFGPDASDPAFAFAGSTEFLTLSATVADVSATAQIELIKQPDPFVLHGDPTWLSIDLRVFVMRPGESKFGVTMGNGATAATDFIQQVAKNLTNGGGTAASQSFDDSSVLSPDEEQSALYLYATDNQQRPVYNFALARVRYVGLIGASDVRVFFRLFQAQTTSGAFDYPPGYQYRRAPSNPAGQPIPLAGIIGNEYVTIPFFALPRVDSTVSGMDQQVDSRDDGSGTIFGNVQRIVAHGDGSEVDTFFGSWLDINQSQNVLPAQVDSLHPDGPFQSISNPALPIQQAILRSLHQCLIAEVAFDPVTIPPGKDPSNWDKLAQRNLAWSDVGSATAVTTFEIRPTPVGLAPGQMVDELMIDWGGTPDGSVGTLYLPAANADEILSLASRMYVTHGLTRHDRHTLKCRTGGVTYVPIPPASGSNYAGLITVEPASSHWHGKGFTVVVRQVTNAFRAQRSEVARTRGKVRGNASSAQVHAGGRGGIKYEYSQWRRVMGAFQLNIPVRQKGSLRLTEERNLALLRWIAGAISSTSRWHPVFSRYLDVIAGRVKAFGGDPSQIKPSPTGTIEPTPAGMEKQRYTGKIVGLAYDEFGDFDGFVLRTPHGEHHFHSREQHIALLAKRVWDERLRVTVWAHRGSDHVAASIVIHEPPIQFGDHHLRHDED
ncbi:sialidase family protein [Paraburkholderia sp. Cpub6]|uniref:sialidase family protein n=1 Tax=Paraburkholderia sp. Cpub6 TaxID=2723094 RepID=UPI001615FC72|nr:sialidase family protein [Paraburkholderia sp. Cpub6]MBB5463603.1 hypothetical protein [Paraburkholderia sp. Cpub6]